MMSARILVTALAVVALSAGAKSARSESPSAAYIFPAGGQRGTNVAVRIGGHFLHDKPEFLIAGPGVTGKSPIERTPTIWFEGPLIPQPASQQKEDYPKDYTGEIKIAADAPLGVRYWHCTTSQGITPGMRFVIGDLPEFVEEESDASPVPRLVSLPVTINGRIFPREDVDDWSIEAKAGQVITCEVNAARLGSGLDSRLEVLGPDGQVLAENSDAFGLDSFVRFTAPRDGKYTIRIHDIRFEGLQHFVYRLTISAGPWLDRVYPLGGKRGTTIPLQLFGANLPSERLEFEVPSDSTTAGRVQQPNPALIRFYANGGGANRLATTLPGGIETCPLGVVTDHGTANLIHFEVDDLPEQLEAEPNDEAAQAKSFDPSSVLNGRIDRPGDVDAWAFTGHAGEEWQFDLRASRLGSELDGVLTLLDEKGQTVATADDLANGQTDAVLVAKLPAEGRFILKVSDRIGSRGGPAFGYRVRAKLSSLTADALAKRGGADALPKPTKAIADQPILLTASVDSLTLLRGGEAKLKLLANRSPGFADELTLQVDGLPEGVTVANNPKLQKGQNQQDIVLKADATAKLATSRLKITAQYKQQEETRTVVASIQRPLGEPEASDLLLRVGVPTPFKLKGIFETKYAPRGSTFTRRYQVERNGFDGPLWVEIADRQARHLQGVTGPKIALAAGVSEFEYAFTLPPNMEIGRTSRTCLAVFGEVADADGSQHVVSHTSVDQNEQCIVLIDPNRLNVEAMVRSVRREPGGDVRIPFRVARGLGLRGPVRAELLIPNSLAGVVCDPMDVPEGSNTGMLTLRFSTDAVALRSQRTLKLRVSMPDETGRPVTDEVEIRLV
jgi:hypothetical protein